MTRVPGVKVLQSTPLLGVPFQQKIKKVFVLVQKSYVYAQDYPLEEEGHGNRKGHRCAQIVKISPSLIKLCVSITHHHFLVIVSTTQAIIDTAKVVDLISCTKFT